MRTFTFDVVIGTDMQDLNEEYCTLLWCIPIGVHVKKM